MKTNVQNLEYIRNWTLIILLLLCGIISALAQEGIPENAVTYVAKGRNGWLIGQELSFGPYQTGKVKRSWTSAPSFEFIVRLQKAKDKFRFEMTDDQGNTSEVFMSGMLSRKELPLFDGTMSLGLPDEDVFVGLIVSKDKTWQFYLENPNKQTVLEKSNGILSDGEQTITIEESRYLSNGKKHIGGEALAYQFQLNGKVVGMVEVINKGKVILDDSLNADQKFVLANAAAALLLRQNLTDALDE